MKNITLIILLMLALFCFQSAKAAQDLDSEMNGYIKSLINLYQNMQTCSPAAYVQGDASWKVTGIKNGKCQYAQFHERKMILECLLPLSYAKSYGENKVRELKQGKVIFNSNDGFNNYCKAINY